MSERGYHEIIEAHAELVPPSFALWVRDFGLERALQPIVYTVLAWTAFCSPAEASAEARAVACMDLALCFFFLDDYQGDDVGQLYDEMERQLDGRAPHEGAAPLHRAYDDIFRRMASRGLPLDRYRESRRELLRCYRRRGELSAGRATATFEEYVALRTTTIYVDQWLDLWEVLDGFYLTAAERALPALGRARSSMNRWHVYENDLASIDRDARARVPNLVPLRARERGLEPEQAAAEVQALADEEERSFTEACREVRQGAPSPSLERYVALLEACYRGGVENYRRKNPARYAASAR